MTFDREKLVKKPTKVKAIYTSNGRESERKNPEPDPKKPFYERMGIWGYTITVLGLGVTLGALFGAFSYSLTATTDEKLLDDVKYYKDQSRIAVNEVDSLKNENDLLLSERESLQEQLTGMQKDNKTLEQSLKKVNEELNQYKDAADSNSINGNASKTSTGKVTNSEEKEINLNESVSFFKGKINVAAFGIGSSSTSIQVGAPGFDSEKHYTANVGTQFDYESDSKYQIRVNKIDYVQDKIVIQVTEF